MRLTVNQKAAAILDRLTDGMEPGTVKKVDNNSTFMALSVARLTDNLYSMAHYFEQNGDICPDPDMTFLKTSDGWVPVDLTQIVGAYTLAVEHDGVEVTGYRPRALRELKSFAAMWLNNIKSQQGV